jgi:hypothetical protein
MKYKGSCHCGKVVFEVEGEIDLEAVPVMQFDGRSL